MQQTSPNEITQGIWTQETPQRFFGLEIGTRMTIIQLNEGLLIHSPINVDPTSINHLGTLRWVVAPNLFHHLYVGPWIDAGAEGWCAKGLPEKRPEVSFTGILDDTTHPFGPDISIIPIHSMSVLNEVIFCHHPTRTLIVTDLLFHIPETAPLKTRVAFRCLGAYPGCCSTLLERVTMKRALAREEIGAVLDLDFDRIILPHGDIIETGGKDALRNAYKWLL